MVTVIVSLNLLIALFCLSIAWWVWQLRRQFAIVADILTDAEYSTRDLLRQAPEAIVQGQLNVYQLRQHYQLLTLRLQQVQQILAVVGLGQLAWQHYRRYRREASTGERSMRPFGKPSNRRSSLGSATKNSRIGVNR